MFPDFFGHIYNQGLFMDENWADVIGEMSNVSPTVCETDRFFYFLCIPAYHVQNTRINTIRQEERREK